MLQARMAVWARAGIGFSVFAWCCVLGCDSGTKPLPLVTQQGRVTAGTAEVGSAEPAATPAELEEATRILDKAIVAHGGPARLARLNSVSMEMKGSLRQFPAEQKLFLQFPQRLRAAIELTKETGREPLELGVNPTGGWLRSQGQVLDMPGAQADDTRRELYVQWLFTLMPVKNEKIPIRPLPEVTGNGRTLVGIAVIHTTYPTVHLYIDRESNLLTRVLIPRWIEAGQQQSREILISRHKSVDGTQLAAALVERRNGEPYLEWVNIEYRIAPQLDEKSFERP